MARLGAISWSERSFALPVLSRVGEVMQDLATISPKGLYDIIGQAYFAFQRIRCAVNVGDLEVADHGRDVLLSLALEVNACGSTRDPYERIDQDRIAYTQT